jgi:hypothetical protein
VFFFKICENCWWLFLNGSARGSLIECYWTHATCTIEVNGLLCCRNVPSCVGVFLKIFQTVGNGKSFSGFALVLRPLRMLVIVWGFLNGSPSKILRRKLLWSLKVSRKLRDFTVKNSKMKQIISFRSGILTVFRWKYQENFEKVCKIKRLPVLKFSMSEIIILRHFLKMFFCK